MAGGYKVPRDAELGLRAMFRDLQKQIDALRGAAKLTSATISKGGLSVEDGSSAAAGGREQITAAEGYQSFDSTSAVQTQIKNGKLTTRDGDFTGTITGSSIVGGAIAIAQGTASTLDESFETATGTTPPAGWTRTVIASNGTAGDVDFQTTGGNPGSRLRMRLPQIAASGADANRIVYPTTLSGKDFVVEFDYRWTGTSDPNALTADAGLLLRASPTSPADDAVAGVVRLKMINGKMAIYDAAGFRGTATGTTPVNTWARIRVELRGSVVSVKVGAAAAQTFAVTGIAAAGGIVFRSYAYGFLAPYTVDQTIDIDNVNIQVLQTGLSVTPDGNVTAERLIVNQSAQVPSPLMPGDATNKAYVDAKRTAGLLNATTDAGGAVVVTHGGSTVPKSIQLAGRNAGHYPYLTGVTATTFTAQFISRSTGAPLTSATSVTFDWGCDFA